MKITYVAFFSSHCQYNRFSINLKSLTPAIEWNNKINELKMSMSRDSRDSLGTC